MQVVEVTKKKIYTYVCVKDAEDFQRCVSYPQMIMSIWTIGEEMIDVLTGTTSTPRQHNKYYAGTFRGGDDGNEFELLHPATYLSRCPPPPPLAQIGSPSSSASEPLLHNSYLTLSRDYGVGDDDMIE